MNLRDNKLINVAFEAFRMYDKGFLPEDGGYGEQPLLFCILSQKVKEKLDWYERKQIEESKLKSKTK